MKNDFGRLEAFQAGHIARKAGGRPCAYAIWPADGLMSGGPREVALNPPKPAWCPQPRYTRRRRDAQALAHQLLIPGNRRSLEMAGSPQGETRLPILIYHPVWRPRPRASAATDID